MEKNDIERLSTILAESHLTQKEFAEKIGMTQSSISDILNGRVKKLSTKLIIALAREFKLNPDWIRSGIGNKYDNDILTKLNEPESVENQVHQENADIQSDKILKLLQTILDADHIATQDKLLLIENLNLLTNHLNMTRMLKVRDFLSS